MCQNPLSFSCGYGCFALTLHLALALPLNLALRSLWLCFYLAWTFPLPCLTLPWTCPDLVLTLSWPCLDLTLALPWHCLDIALTLLSTFPWLFLDLAETLLDLALTLPLPCPNSAFTLPQACIDLVFKVEIFLIWTNVTCTIVAWTNITVTVGICSRCPGTYRVFLKNFTLGIFIITPVTNMLEGLDIFHLKGGIHSSVWSTETFPYNIREQGYKQNNMGYQIRRIWKIYCL